MSTPNPGQVGQGAPSRRLWAAGAEPADERTTARLRRVVDGLPEWSPLPPGEQLIRRPGATRGES
ncbi:MULTISPECIES: hypothetical protein [unclassified Streptomyces]|uniref:hypothetical protein n=1 Tax=unclassified Streptomyces TaxID=2593676 RepID=UPI001BEA4FD8|nr:MULTISPECIES: hypothetical protein [unclassified Streptomyces]MBT2405117.1 hypothetical protein [Streptomyces sp. ISL-21]MBT2458710.1 hypothetical protein [Streptomyces sp. ISL-86]MBT2610885.1 hypothetical protein [Streptomyces sp. ISL-87]